jgi:excisionase family DNA binding protein
VTEQTTALPLPQAAKALGLTTRTVLRQVAAGRLSGTKTGGRWVIDVPASLASATALTTSGEDVLRARLRDAEATIARLTAERDSAVSERDRVWATLNATLSRALPEPTPAAPAPRWRARWRWPWQA